MFVVDFCEDWSCSKTQDDFIRSYFSKGTVNSTKTSNVPKSVDKARNVDVKSSTSNLVKQDNEFNHESFPHSLANKRPLDYQGECNKKRRKEEKHLQNFSQDSCSEIQPQSQNAETIEFSNSESNHLKTKKKKRSKNRKKNISCESSELTETTGDSKSKTKAVSDDFSAHLEKGANLDCSESNSNFLKQKKKKKRLKNKAKTTSEEKSSMPDDSFDETRTIDDHDTVSGESSITENNFSKSNSDSNCLKMKNKKLKNSSAIDKFSDEVDAVNIVKDFNEFSVKKNNLVQSKAYQKLQAAKFRYLNEMLYTNSGKDALSYFQENTDEYLDYHEGYQSQVSKWPINPVDIIIQEISRMNKQAVIADLGCGEARIAEVFPNRTVYSFDLIALKECVTACDIANVSLPSCTVDVVVFCLSLMGTNWKDYLKEGHRILKLGGTLKIAEIESRIENLQHFIKEIENVGFTITNQNLSHKMFLFLTFKRVNKSKKSSKLPGIMLKPCLYKKR